MSSEDEPLTLITITKYSKKSPTNSNSQCENKKQELKICNTQGHTSRVFIRHWRSENCPSITHNSPAIFHLFPERALLFHNNSPVTLHYSPGTTILN